MNLLERPARSLAWTVATCAPFVFAVDTVSAEGGPTQLVLHIEYGGSFFGFLERCVTIEVFDQNCIQVFETEEEALFFNGLTTLVIEIPAGDYALVRARDRLHTLARVVVPIPIDGGDYVAYFTTDNDKEWLAGNFNDDDVIDEVDVEIWAKAFGTNYGDGDTDCETPPPHCDISGNGLVGGEEFTWISTNFEQVSDPICEPCPWDLNGDGVVNVLDLIELVMNFGPCEGCPADFDGDGFVNVLDLIALIMNFGPCPGTECVWDVNGDGVVDKLDVQAVTGNLGPCKDPEDCPWDVNGDGVVDGSDVQAVASHLGPCP